MSHRPILQSDALSRRTFMALSGCGIMALGIPRLAVGQTDPLTMLAPDLIEDLVALGETLIPEDVTPGMSRSDVLSWLDSMLKRDESTPVWLQRSMPTLQGGVTEAVGGQSFHMLSSEDRHAVLVHLLDDPGSARESDWNRRVVRPLMAWFFNTPRGYTVVGYQNHTGSSLAGDVTSYTGPGQIPGERGGQ